MKKLSELALVAITVLGVLLLISLFTGKEGVSLAGVGSDPSYGVEANATTTNTAVNCPSATSTQIVGIQTGRTSFAAANNSTNTIWMCKNAQCASSTAGFALSNSTGSVPRYEQQDSYVGAWSCVSQSGTSSLGVSHSGK